LTDEFKPGDRVRFTVGEGHLAFTGYGVIAKTTNESTMVQPDRPFPSGGLRISKIEKVVD
jgi:hypothetical protein